MNVNSSSKYPYSILFVDDENEIRENYVAYLKTKFSTVYEARNGSSGYDVYLKHKPDIIVSDIKMPTMNGIDFIKKVRENDHSTRVVLMTSYMSVDYLKASIELKLTKFLYKPIARDTFKSAIDEVLTEIAKYKTVSKKCVYLKYNYRYDINTKDIYKENELVPLTKSEKHLLIFFFDNQNKFVTYQDIAQYIWNSDNEDKTEAIKNILKKLRKKIPEGLIENIYGAGYKLNI